MAFMHLSDDRGTGPNRFVWFLETVMLVGLSYLLAYLVPQVINTFTVAIVNT